jgi:riboflavin synthase
VFSGIITAVATVTAYQEVSGGCELTITSPWDDVEPGESVAVDGACLTVTNFADGQFVVHVITTSLDRTLFLSYRAGRRVNLERALRAGDRLGGHLVQGHVDGVGTVESVRQRDDARLLVIGVPSGVAAVSIPLGSIAVDGVSLTVDAIPAPETVQVSLIPFTLQHTTLGDKSPGDQVHLEGDTVGKYVQHFWAAWSAAAPR